MSKRTDLLFLNDIIDSAEAIESFVKGIDFDAFVNDRKTYSATLRELEVIGEAAGKLSDDLKAANPHVDWRILKDFRNVLAHEYFGVNPEIVWDIVQNKISGLKGTISAIIASQEKCE